MTSDIDISYDKVLDHHAVYKLVVYKFFLFELICTPYSF